MNTLYRALNINNDQELEALVESLDLTDSQYIHFMSALNEDLSEDGMRYVLENMTKSFDNGSYEKLQEQFKKKTSPRRLKKVEEDTVYDHSWYEVKGGKYPKRTKEGVVCEAYNKFKNIVKKINPILASSEKEGIHLWCQKELIKEFFEKYPNSINDYVYLEEEKITAANRIAGVYNPKTNEDDDSKKHLWKHEIDDEMFENGWTRYFIMDMNGGRRLYISGVDRGDVIKSYKYLKNKYSNLNITLYILDYMNGNSTDTLYFDENGNRTVLETKEYSLLKKIIEKFISSEPLNEAKDVEDSLDTVEEEPIKEEKPVSTADPEIAKFIDQTEKVADNTMNPEILQGLSDSVEAKIPLATDVEQMNKLGELKAKIETKLNAAQKAPVVEGYEYNPDDEEYADVGDKVEFDWNVEGKGEVRIKGTVKEVQTLRKNRYYNIASYNPETERVELYYRVDPVSNDMKRIYYDEELDETASCGATCCGSVASVVKPIGKTVKRKNKKKIPEAIDTKLFKESIYTDTPAETVLEGHKMKYFMNEGKWYLSCDNALVKTFDKNVMIESIDQILDGEEPSCGLLEGYSCYEMNILMEDITSGNSAGTSFSDDEQLKAAIFASAEKNKGSLTADDKNKIENNADDPEIERQNKDAAEKLSLSVGQNVDIMDPDTSELKQVQLSGVDKEKGLAFIKNAEGGTDIEPASKIQKKV